MSAVVFLMLGAMLAYHQTRHAPRVLFLASAIFLTVIVGISRIYLGLHFPTDVIASWGLGTAWAIACVLIAQRFAPRVLTASQVAV